jgi:hypothetical protein
MVSPGRAAVNRAATELETQVRTAFEGTPYVVTRTPSGFEVTLDVANARWYGLFDKAGLRYSFTHEVEVAGSWFAITDVEREVRWSAGVPRISGSGRIQKGRVIRYASEKTWAFDQDGRFRAVVDYRFDSEEARSVIVHLGKQLGLKYRMSTHARVGLAFALIAIIGLVLGGVVIAVLAAMGAL